MSGLDGRFGFKPFVHSFYVRIKSMNSYVTVLIIFLTLLIFTLFRAWREAVKHDTGIGDEFVGICSVAFERSSHKEECKRKALAFITERKEAGNSEIREVLEKSSADRRVSARSIRRYMSELVEEGKIKQIGNTGRSVVYRLSNNG